MRPSGLGEAPRRGAALTIALLLTLGMFALAHGLLVSSLREVAASQAAVRELEARAAAQAAVRRALEASPGPWMDSVSRLRTRTVWSMRLGRADALGRVRRLGTEAWLAEGHASVRAGARSGAALLAWSLDPLTRVSALDAAVSVNAGAPVTLAGSIEVTDPTSVPAPLTPADCAAWTSTLEARYALSSLRAITHLPPDSTGLGPGLGPLGFDSLLLRPEMDVSGLGTPGPTEVAGSCASEAWNWGDPDRSWRPCGPYFALRRAFGDVAVQGGVGQGILIVDGNLALQGGARFHGLLVVRGTLSLTNGARMHGMALASGGIELDASSRLRASPCWALRALTAHRERLGAFVTLAPGEWVGPL